MSTLCRRCFHLVPAGREWVLCLSDRCREVADLDGELSPLVLDPRREEGLWSRFSGRVNLDAPCPVCAQLGTLRLACPRCHRELPGAETADDHVIAVLGAKDAGKTHYLATLYHALAEAEEPAGGEAWELELDEAARERLRAELWRPLFEEMRELEATPATRRPEEMNLLLHHRETGRRVLAVFQDLSGEILSDRRRLAREELVLHARGVILLADPLAFDGRSRGRRGAWHHGQPTCVEVLRAYRQAAEERAHRAASREEQAERNLLPEHKVLAVAVTKADLVLRSRSHPFWDGAGSAAAWESGYWERRAGDDRLAREWLLERTGPELARLARPFADVGWFFVSSFGYEHKPHTETLVKPPSPLRVHEPLFALLDRFAAEPAARRRPGRCGAEVDRESPIPEAL
jgi:hypothetical protein